MFKPTDELTIVLEAQQWNVVLQLLAEGPYRLVQPLLAAIQAQSLEQQGRRARVALVPDEDQPTAAAE